MTTLDMLISAGIQPKKVSALKGGEYASPCPVCGGEDRFHVWPQQGSNGTFWCRQCGIGGDAIQFLIDINKMSFPVACKQLGRELPKQIEGQTPKYKHPATDTWQPRETATPQDIWLEKTEAFVQWAHNHLLNNQEQLNYLAGRGVKKESIIKYRLGYNPGEKGKDIYRPRKAWGLEVIKKPDGKDKKLWLPLGIVIPYYHEETPKRIRIRRQEGEPRYYVVPGSAMDTYMSNPSAKAFVIVESELDAILIEQEAGDLIGCIALGNAQSKPTACAANVIRNSLHICNALDYDEAGKAQNKWWGEHYPQTERWPVPEGKDPGDYYKTGGNIREWIIAGLPPGLRPALGGGTVPDLPAKKSGAVESGLSPYTSPYTDYITEDAQCWRCGKKIELFKTVKSRSPKITCWACLQLTVKVKKTGHSERPAWSRFASTRCGQRF